MPIYEYKCEKKKCRKTDSVFLSFSALENYSHYCSVCGSHSDRIYSIPAVIYVGPGFYTNDSKDHGSSQRVKDKAKVIKDLWKSNTKLRKKIKKYGNY